MQDLLAQIRTPYKHAALILRPSYQQGAFDSHAVDCPFVFSFAERYYMTYVGWDKIGYRTGLAVSEDLLHWHKEGLLIDRGPAGSVTEYNAALTSILRENDLYSPGTLRRVNGDFVGTYHAYPQPGYETGPAVIGLCFSADLRRWQMGEPILRPDPGLPWEAGGLYKSWLMEHAGIYYLFYNAKTRSDGHWIEQTGVATSSDLVHWEKYPGNPILRVGPQGAFDDLFVSDPCVLRLSNGGWVMFYFGNASDGHARDSAAFSTDLLHWEKAGEVLVDVGPAGSCDAKHAHKAAVIAHAGELFHFYCAVAPTPQPEMGEVKVDELRGISVARSGGESLFS